MNKKQAYQKGYDNGHGIATSQILSYPKDSIPERDEFVGEVCEHEADVFRQYSPFEFFVAEIRESQEQFGNGDGLWESYNDGVEQGAHDAYVEFVEDMEV